MAGTSPAMTLWKLRRQTHALGFGGQDNGGSQFLMRPRICVGRRQWL